MSRWGRRLWRWSAALFALLVILLATLVGLFRLAAPLVPGYRAQVAVWASGIIHHPVEIGSMSAEWGWYGPEVELGGVRILSKDGAQVVVSAQEVRLDLSLWSLVHGKLPLPSRIVLVEPQAELHRDSQGVFSIAGLEGAAQQTPTDWKATLKDLFTQSAELSIQKGRLTYVEAGEPRPMLFQSVDLSLDNAADSHKVSGDVQLPAEFGRSFAFKLKVEGEELDPKQWVWSGSVDGVALQVPRLLRYWPEYAGRFGHGVVDLDGEMAADHGVLQKFTADVNARDMMPMAAPLDAFQLVAGHVDWERNVSGWRLQGHKLQLQRGTSLWPRTDLSLEYGDDGKDVDWSGSAGFLRLQDLTALASWLPEEFTPDLKRLAEFAPTGDVSAATFKVHLDGKTLGDWSVEGRFQDLGLHKSEGWPGFSGMSGDVKLDQTGGAVKLAAQGASVDFTPLFRTPLRADTLTLDTTVTHDAAGWKVAADGFRVANPDAAAHGDVAMQFPVDGSAPRLDIEAVVDRADARNKSIYFPVGIMPKDVVKWLDDSIKGGQVPTGSVSIHGKTSDFPFDKGGGVFDIRFHLLHGELDYADGWPAVKDLDADVRFLDQGLSAHANSGMIAGGKIVDATASFADLATGVLTIDGSVKGDTDDALKFLRSPPMKDVAGHWLDSLKGAGEADTRLHAVLPVEDLGKFELQGATTLKGASLMSSFAPAMVADQLQGVLEFNRDGLSTRGVEGRILGGPVHVVIQSGKGRKKDLTEFTAQGSAQAGAVMDQFRPMPDGWLEGAAAWRLEGRIPGKISTNTAAFSLALHSDLIGLGVDLPQPFTKPLEDSLPLDFHLKLLNKDSLSATASYGDAIGARVDFVSAGDAWKFDRGNLNLGEGDVYLPDDPGFTVTGNVERFSWDEWKRFLPPASASTAPPGTLPPAATPLPAFVQGADLTVGQLEAFDQRLTGLHLLLSRDDDGWLAKLDSKAAAGTLTLPVSVDADHPLKLDMDRLLLTRQTEPKSAAPAAASGVTPVAAATSSGQYDPRRIPALKFTGRHFEYGDLKLGNASFVLMPLADGVALQDLKVDSDTFGITGDGTWKVTPAGAQSAALDVDVKSRDVGKTLSNLGFAPAITGSKGEINAALNWRDGPFGDIVRSLSGSLHVKLEDGQIVDVQPGAGRVFGLLSLNALPRRLLLNFSDVFAKGFGYDSIEGDFTLQDGDAYTKDMQVKGPAARITLIGRTGLARRDFDEALIVDPNVGSTLPVVGALAGGLGVGAVVLLLTEVFKKPISAAGETRYHLTGTWDNPVLTKENAAPPAKKTP